MMAKNNYYYFLIFGGKGCWQTCLLKKGFCHVIIGIRGEDTMLFIEKKLSGIDVRAFKCVDDTEMIKSIMQIPHISRVDIVSDLVFNNKDKIGLYFNLGTCVSIIKQYLHIKWYKAFTPYGLFKYLSKRNQLTNIFKR